MSAQLLLSVLFALSQVHAATFTDSLVPYVFSYDENIWEVVSASAAKGKVESDADKAMAQKTLSTLQMKKSDRGYRTRIGVVLDSLEKFPGDPATQLEKYRAYTEKFLTEQHFSIEKRSDKPGNFLAAVNVPQHQFIGYQRDFGLKFWQVIFIHTNHAYLVTAATRVEKFDEYQPALKAVLNSIRFLP